MASINSKNLILVVDDIESNISLMTSILRKAGYDVMASLSGAKALRMIKKRQPDLVLLDVMMPEIDGLEVSRRMQADEDLREIPVIFLSAVNESEMVVKGLETGAVDYIPKPFQEAEVLARIETHLRLRRLEKERAAYTKEIESLYQKIQIDLEIARETQKGIVASEFPKSDHFQINSFYQPFDQVGGDLISYDLKPDGSIDLLFGDISGHGVPAALISGMYVLAFKIACTYKAGPKQALELINDLVGPMTSSHFLCAVAAKYIPENRKFIYSYAGHHPIVRMRGKNLDLLEGKGTALNLMENEVHLNEYELDLSPGDRILMYSDGLFEVADSDYVMLTNEGFVEYLQNQTGLTGQNLLENLVSNSMRVSGGEVRDDMSLLLMEVL